MLGQRSRGSLGVIEPGDGPGFRQLQDRSPSFLGSVLLASYRRGLRVDPRRVERVRLRASVTLEHQPRQLGKVPPVRVDERVVDEVLINGGDFAGATVLRYQTSVPSTRDMGCDIAM